MRHVIEEVKEIWNDKSRQLCCRQIWCHFIDIARENREKLGTAIFDAVDTDKYPVVYDNKEHEVVRWLAEAANEMNCPNLHLGLTSSDVEENARLMQILSSRREITTLVQNVRDRIHRKFQGFMSVGKTHLQTAGITPYRYQMWKRVLRVEMPKIIPKLPAGIVGCRFETPDVVSNVVAHMDWSVLGFDDSWADATYRQSTSMQCELDYCHFLSGIAAGVVKICKDIRYLISTGELDVQDLTASSSGPGKNNPVKFERAESICYTIPNAYRSVWEAAANDMLEGTLTRKWTLDHEIAEASIRITDALATLWRAIDAVNCKHIQLPDPNEFSSYVLSSEVVNNGKRRDVAYNELYNKSH
jgi:adenylosuccinate lyase